MKDLYCVICYLAFFSFEMDRNNERQNEGGGHPSPEERVVNMSIFATESESKTSATYQPSEREKHTRADENHSETIPLAKSTSGNNFTPRPPSAQWADSICDWPKNLFPSCWCSCCCLTGVFLLAQSK